jgi:hypothetical protein
MRQPHPYGFHLFQHRKSFEPFPSDHAAVSTAVMSVLWMQFPRLGAVCAVGLLGTDVALVQLNLHLVNNVVAGTFLAHRRNSSPLAGASLARVIHSHGRESAVLQAVPGNLPSLWKR